MDINKEIIQNEWHGELNLVIYYEYDGKTPNEVCNCWQQVVEADPELIVEHPKNGTKWVNICTGITARKLAQDSRFKNVTNAQKEAYKFLQDQLVSELEGLYVVLYFKIFYESILMYHDHIHFDYHENYDVSLKVAATTMAKTHFKKYVLLAHAKDRLAKLKARNILPNQPTQ